MDEKEEAGWEVSSERREGPLANFPFGREVRAKEQEPSQPEERAAGDRINPLARDQVTTVRSPAATTRFAGAKYGDELLAHYCAADVFVFPSLTDTLGFVMMEALACGIPVAAFPVQGPVDVIGDSGAGVLSDDLASAVEQAVGIDPEICRGRALQFSWPRSAGEFIANLAPITASSSSWGIL